MNLNSYFIGIRIGHNFLDSLQSLHYYYFFYSCVCIISQFLISNVHSGADGPRNRKLKTSEPVTNNKEVTYPGFYFNDSNDGGKYYIDKSTNLPGCSGCLKKKSVKPYPYFSNDSIGNSALTDPIGVSLASKGILPQRS